MKLYLVRHGETVWNTQRRMQGITDVTLTHKGKQQTKKIAIQLKGIKFDAIYSSPLQRALDTARAIHAFHPDIPFQTHDHLVERAFGELESKTYDEMIALYPFLAFETTWNHPNFRPKGGESLTDVKKRVKTLLKYLIKKHDGETILVVSHGVTLKVMVSILISVPLHLFTDFWLGNTSLSFIDCDTAKGNSAQFVNQMFHLDES